MNTMRISRYAENHGWEHERVVKAWIVARHELSPARIVAGMNCRRRQYVPDFTAQIVARSFGMKSGKRERSVVDVNYNYYAKIKICVFSVTCMQI